MIRLLVPLVAFLVLVPTAAVADDWSYDDARRDVVEIVPGGHGEVRYVARPRDRGADITRLAVDADSRRVVVRVVVRDLVRERVKNLSVNLVTASRDVVAEGYQDAKEPGSIRMFDEDTLQYVACDRRLGIRFRFAADVIRVVIPSACLGDPSWVRVGAQLGAMGEDAMVEDDALRAGQDGRAGRLGPRVPLS